MIFSWNENNRRDVLETRGVDLRYAALIFEGPTLVKQDTRADYGETRWIALGVIDEVPHVVVYTLRGDAIRLITAWKGGRKDYERYKESFP